MVARWQLEERSNEKYLVTSLVIKFRALIYLLRLLQIDLHSWLITFESDLSDTWRPLEYQLMWGGYVRALLKRKLNEAT
jgi:hypothetical protein